MIVHVQFFSWFKDSAGCARTNETVPAGCTLGELFDRLLLRFPGLAPCRPCALMAVGVEYQKRDYVLKDGDEVSLFPPVQGG
jgi:molybdopterin converting factor small subunit